MINVIEDVDRFDVGDGVEFSEKGGLKILCDAPGSHRYIFGYRFAVPETMDGFRADAYFVEADPDVQACFYCYDKSGKLISKEILTSNQVMRHPFSSESALIEVYFRVCGVGWKSVEAVVVGSFDRLAREVSRRFKFSGEFGSLPDNNVIDNKYVFVLETLFCDTETRFHVMERYYSFLTAQLGLFREVTGRPVFWVVHFSSDKHYYADRFSERVEELGLSGNVIVNMYEHPAGGYASDHEENVDRRIKPNATFPELRDRLFNSAAGHLCGALSSFTGGDTIFVRGVLDDDDFLNVSVFSAMAREIEKVVSRGGLTPFVVINKNILVSYFGCYGSKVLVDKVRFKRVVCGCRFSVARGGWPVHPFAINETVSEKVNISGIEMPVYDFSDFDGIAFSYSYNRHFLNLSSSRKNFFYDKVYGSVSYSDHVAFASGFQRFAV